MAYATVQDIEAVLLRELTAEEKEAAEFLLESVEAIIKTHLPNLDEKIANGKISKQLVTLVEVNAVIRVLRNPEAFISENDGSYSYERSKVGASGLLQILPNEWEWLYGSGNGVGQYQLVPVVPDGGVEGMHQWKGDHWLTHPSWSWIVQVP